MQQCVRLVLSCVAAGVTGIALAAGAAGQSAAPAGAATSAQAATARSQTAEPNAKAKEVDDSYVIGPGDTLRVFVLRNPELTAEVPVRPDGRISTPLVDDVVAVGKTPRQLASDIETKLSEFVRNPVVNIIVSHATGSFGQVRVVGQAVNARALPFRAGLTILDVVIEVGGLSPYAAGNRAKIVRSESGHTREIRVRLQDLINKGDVSQNIEMRPGDVVVIPETRF
jgi:polysaccharide export outer membrane protein